MGSQNCQAFKVSPKIRNNSLLSPKEIYLSASKTPSLFNFDGFTSTTLERNFSFASGSAAMKSAKIRRVKKQCPGDFCNCLINSSDQLAKSDIEVEDLFTEIRKLYELGKEKDINNVKLSLRVDYLLNERNKKTSRDLINDVPYKLLLKGKALLDYTNFTSSPQNHLVKLESKQILQAMRSIDASKLELHNPPHVSKLYDTVQVCSHCYEVYKILRSKTHSEKANELVIRNSSIYTRPTTANAHFKGTSSRLISPKSAISIGSFSTSTNFNWFVNPDRRPSAEHNRINSVNVSTSKVDVNNINELLLDMQKLLIEKKIKKSGNVKAEDLEKILSRLNRPKTIQRSAKKRPTIDTKRVTEPNPEALILSLFPDANNNIGKKPKSKAKWMAFIDNLKTQSFGH